MIGRLVQQQNTGTAGQYASKAGPRALTAAQGGERRVPGKCSKPKPFEHGCYALLDVVAASHLELVDRAAIFFDQVTQIRPGSFDHRSLDPQEPGLRLRMCSEAEPDDAAKRSGCIGLKPLRQHGARSATTLNYVSFIWLLHTGDDAQQRRLAGTVGSDEAYAFTRVDYD